MLDDLVEKRRALWELTNNFIILDILRDKQDTDDGTSPSYSELFVKKYLMNYRGLYQFCGSIFNHILTGFLNSEQFIKEFEPSENKVYYDALHKINDYLILSDEDLNSNIKLIFDALEKGVYNIYSHQSIFQKLNDLSAKKLLSLSTDEIKDKVYKSLDIAKSRNEDFDRDTFERGDFYAIDNEEAKEIFAKIRELHDEYFHSKRKNDVFLILSKLEDKEASYADIIHSFLWINLSEFFSAEDCINKIKTSSNYSISKFFRFLAEKYRYDDYKTKNDVPFIKELVLSINKIIETAEISAHKSAVLSDGLRILNNIEKEFLKRKQ